MATTSQKVAAASLFAALAGAGITASVMAQTKVVVPQSEHTWLTGETWPTLKTERDGGITVIDGGFGLEGHAKFYNRSCGRVLSPEDGGITAEPCFEGYIEGAEQKIVEQYFKLIVTPRVVKAAK